MNFYKLLGVSPDATYQEIKKAFYKKAKKFHPDINPGSEDTFKLILKAYQTLINPQEREKYNNLIQGSSGFISLTEKFMDFLGFTDKPKKGSNIKVKLNLSLKEAIEGAKKELSYKRKVLCEVCEGCGFTENSKVMLCDRCEGGKIKTKFGSIVCPHCLGKGFVIYNPCHACGGKGFYTKMDTISINVPVGVKDREKLVVKGLGNIGLNGGDYGDLIVIFKVDSGVYQIDGKDLILRIKLPGPVEDYEKINLKTPTGEKISVKLPQESLPFKVRLKGYGYIDKTGIRGDLILYLF